MKTLVAKFLALSLITFACVVCLVWLLPDEPFSYQKAIADKHRMLSLTPGPRIILVGGSNLAFGIDSPRLSRKTGYQVVNMGLQAGFGLRFMLLETLPSLKASDIVIIVPEYELFCGLLDGTPVYMASTVRIYPPAVKFIQSPGQLINLVIGFPETLQEQVLWLENRPATNPVYSLETFNRYGDATLHLDKAGDQMDPKSLFKDYSVYDPTAVSVLNDFYAAALRRNAKVYMIYPPIPQESYLDKQTTIDSLVSELKLHLHIPILGGVENFLYPNNLFYDTTYHLIRKGRERRTDEMARLINGEVK